MALTPPNITAGPNAGKLITERNLLYGEPDAGKSHLIFQIAKAHQDLGSDARFYCINSDGSYDLLISTPPFDSLTNITWWEASNTDMQAFLDASEAIKARAVPERDWVVLDRGNHAWEAAQHEYLELKAAKEGRRVVDMGKLWLDSGITDGGGLNRLVKDPDWNIINGRYNALRNNLLGTGCHVVMVAGEKAVTEISAKDDPTTRKNKRLFGVVGQMPDAQKHDPATYHTIVHVRDVGEGDDRVQSLVSVKAKHPTGKRIGRRMKNNQVAGEEIKDFFWDYLVEIAGWSV